MLGHASLATTQRYTHRQRQSSQRGLSPCPSPRLKTISRVRSTTILCVRHGGHVVMAGDGQVSVGQTVMKRSARKVRRLHDDRVLAGFAGSTADALTLFDKFEAKLQEFNGNLRRAAVELAKDWRTDRDAPPARGDAGRRRRGELAADLRLGRRDRARRRPARDRLGRQFRAGRGAGADPSRPRSERAARSPRPRCTIAAEICVYTNDQLIIEEL